VTVRTYCRRHRVATAIAAAVAAALAVAAIGVATI